MKIFRALLLVVLLLASCKDNSPLTSEVWEDSFAHALSSAWAVSDGWSNGSPFAVGWRSDHVSVKQGKLRLKLNDEACSNSADCSWEDYASGELQTAFAVSYGTVEARLKAASGKGVVNGFFLYAGDSGSANHQEIDVEILGKNTRQVQFNYYVNGVGGHEKVVALGFDASEGFHTYGIQRTQRGIQWWVDGQLRHEVTGSNLPSGEMNIFFNLWAAVGAESWTGTFSAQGLPLWMLVDKVSYRPHGL